MMPRKKYGNKKTEYNGVMFDSALELHCYQMLEKFKIPFKWQVEWELMPKYQGWDGKAIRRIYMRVDFVFVHNGTYIFVDTKGFATEGAKMKYKLLGWQLTKEGREHEIHWLKNKKAVKNFVLDWYDKMKK